KELVPVLLEPFLILPRRLGHIRLPRQLAEEPLCALLVLVEVVALEAVPVDRVDNRPENSVVLTGRRRSPPALRTACGLCRTHGRGRLGERFPTDRYLTSGAGEQQYWAGRTHAREAVRFGRLVLRENQQK